MTFYNDSVTEENYSYRCNVIEKTVKCDIGISRYGVEKKCDFAM